jgi:hypothetical protein
MYYSIETLTIIYIILNDAILMRELNDNFHRLALAYQMVIKNNEEVKETSQIAKNQLTRNVKSNEQSAVDT